MTFLHNYLTKQKNLVFFSHNITFKFFYNKIIDHLKAQAIFGLNVIQYFLKIFILDFVFKTNRKICFINYNKSCWKAKNYLGIKALASSEFSGHKFASAAISNLWKFDFCKSILLRLIFKRWLLINQNKRNFFLILSDSKDNFIIFKTTKSFTILKGL